MAEPHVITALVRRKAEIAGDPLQQRRAQLVRLSDALGTSFIDALKQALDARLKGTR